MSAFLGCVSLRGDALPAEWVAKAALPDQAGLNPPCAWRREGVVFLHRQRVVTPEDRLERQPLARDEDLVVLFDGRLDDRAGLSGALGLGPNVSEQPDSCLVLSAYERWGAEAAAHLIGDYAIAVFEPRQRRLWLTVSPQGQRILYYHRRGDLISFSTSVPALMALPGVSRAIDETALVDFLAVNHSEHERSLYRDITRVCHGTAVLLSAGGGRAHSVTWRPPSSRRLVLRDQREYVEAAREVLDRVVASQLRCIEDVAILGSGGLDSACLATATARMRAQKPIRFVTMVPERGAAVALAVGGYADETPHVAMLAAHVPGLQPEFVRPMPSSELETDPARVFAICGFPIRLVTHIGWIEAAYAHLSRTATTAVLDGTGGNHTLTWDGGRALADLFRTGRWLRLAKTAIAFGGGRPRSIGGLMWRDVVRPTFFRNTLYSRWRENSALRFDVAKSHGAIERIWQGGADPGYIGHASGLVRRAFAATHNRALAAEYYSWIRAKYGVETRLPMWDTRLIEFSLSLPIDPYIDAGRPRALARDLLAVAGLPPSFTDRRSRGVICPEWFTRLDRRKRVIADDIAALRAMPVAAKFIDLDRLQRALATWPVDAAAAAPRKLELDIMLTRAIQVGAFLRWAEDGAEAPAPMAVVAHK